MSSRLFSTLFFPFPASLFSAGRKCLLTVASCLMLSSSLLISAEEDHSKHDHDHDHPHEEAVNPSDLVILTPAQAEVLKVETFESHEQAFESVIQVLGEIEVMPGSQAIVSSRIPGKAESVLIKKDQRVDQGDEILWVESRQPGDPPPVVRLEAPISGVVTQVKISQGQPISPEDLLVEITNFDHVHAAAHVPETLIEKVKIGQKARIRLASLEETLEAEVAHISPMANPENGTIEVSFHLPNPDLKIRPGMLAEFTIATEEEEDVTLIPKKAILNAHTVPYVFVKDFELPHAWHKVYLELGRSNDEFIEVLSGLFPGDEIAVQGAFALNAMGGGGVSLKEALDAAHGHAHNEDGSEIKEETSPSNISDPSHDSHEIPFWNFSAILFASFSGLLLILLLVSAFLKPSPAESH